MRPLLRSMGTVELPSGVTHYRVDGPPDGPTVVFVPGATLPLFVWDGLAEAVAGAGYRTVRYDLLGRGHSSAPRVAYDAALHRRQLSELIAAVDPDGPVRLVALAFGCLIAADVALAGPEQVASLTYLAPDGFGVPLPRGTGLLKLPCVGDALVRRLGARILLKRLEDYSDQPAVVSALRERFEPYAHAPGLHHAVLSSIRHMPIHDAAQTYARVTAPTQVIWGRSDRVTPLPAPDRIAAAFPGASVSILDGVGHLPHVERADAVAREIVGFLDRV